MDTIFHGDLSSSRGRRRAWIDSLLIDHAFFRLVWSNFAPVVPGRLYRSNHPTPRRLAKLARALGLKTLINLRGEAGNGSDALSREAAEKLGLAFIDAPLDSRDAPSVGRVLHLMEVYRTMAEPALLHCKSGADRAGIAAAIYLLAQGRDADEALAQLSLRFGHFRHSRAGVLDAFVLRYRAAAGRPFAEWLQNEYDPAALSREYSARGLISFINDRVLARE